MEAMRKSWTDERLDDLSGRMDGGFERGRPGLASRRSKKRSTRRFDKLEGRFDRLQHTLVQVSLTMLGGVLVALFVGH